MKWNETTVWIHVQFVSVKCYCLQLHCSSSIAISAFLPSYRCYKSGHSFWKTVHDVSVVVSIYTVFIWVITLCSLVDSYEHFRGTCCHHLQGGRQMLL